VGFSFPRMRASPPVRSSRPLGTSSGSGVETAALAPWRPRARGREVDVLRERPLVPVDPHPRPAGVPALLHDDRPARRAAPGARRARPRAALRPGLQLLACPWTAAKLVGEIAGAGRFSTDAKLARASGLAPIPVSSGTTNRHRLDRGGNRQINAAIHRIASPARAATPRRATTLPANAQKARAPRKRSAASSATSPAASGTYSKPPHPVLDSPTPQFLDIGAAEAAPLGVRRVVATARAGLPGPSYFPATFNSSDPVSRAGNDQPSWPLPAVRDDDPSFKMSEDAKFALGY
jgi:Transposase IS116/IS110/IS902 family